MSYNRATLGGIDKFLAFFDHLLTPLCWHFLPNANVLGFKFWFFDFLIYFYFFSQDCWIRHFCHPDIGIYYLNMPYYQDTNCQDLTPFQLIYAGNNLVGFVFQHLAPLDGFRTFQPRIFNPNLKPCTFQPFFF